MLGAIALAAFWILAIRLWIVGGPKVPIILIALWVVAFFGFHLLGLAGYAFIAFEAILTVIMIIVERFKSVL